MAQQAAMLKGGLIAGGKGAKKGTVPVPKAAVGFGGLGSEHASTAMMPNVNAMS